MCQSADLPVCKWEVKDTARGHTLRVAAWRAVRVTHLLVQAVRHKANLSARHRNFGCPMLGWSGDIWFIHLE